jgi:hypothetical protein
MFFVKFVGYHGTYFFLMLVSCPSLAVVIQWLLYIPLQEYSLHGILSPQTGNTKKEAL